MNSRSTECVAGVWSTFCNSDTEARRGCNDAARRVFYRATAAVLLCISTACSGVAAPTASAVDGSFGAAIVSGDDPETATTGAIAQDFKSVVAVILEYDVNSYITYDSAAGIVTYDGDTTRGTGYFACSGSLIAPKVVMTAGHCLDVARSVFIDDWGTYVAVGAPLDGGTYTGEEWVAARYTVVFDKDGDLQDVMGCLDNGDTVETCVAQDTTAVGMVSAGQYRHRDYWDVMYNGAPYAKNNVGFISLSEAAPSGFPILKTLPKQLRITEESLLSRVQTLEVAGFGNTTWSLEDTAGLRRVARVVLGMVCRNDSPCYYPGDLGYFPMSGGANSGDDGGPVFVTVQGKHYVAGVTSHNVTDYGLAGTGYFGPVAEFAFLVDRMDGWIDQVKNNDFSRLIEVPTAQ